MDTITSPELIEIKTELPIEYVNYDEPVDAMNTSFDGHAPVEDIFADVEDATHTNFELVSEIKVEPGTIDNRRNTTSAAGHQVLTCRFCQMKFTDRPQFDTHMGMHMDNDIYLCTKCNFKCTTDDYLIEHYKAFENDVCVPCVICKEEFSRMCYLLNHMEDHRKKREIRPPEGVPDYFDMDTPVTVLACENCDFKTASNDVLRVHLEPSDIGNLIKCNMCKEQFSLRCDFYNHMKEHMSYIVGKVSIQSYNAFKS